MHTNVGWAKVEFPIPPGTQLAGYEGGPPRPASGTHDPLYVRALTLEQCGRRVCIATCDVVAVDARLTQRAARLAREKWGVDDFFFAATHGHSGPAGLFEEDDTLGALVTFIVGKPDRALIDSLESCVLQAVGVSVQNERPATLRAGTVKSPGIGTDRNDPARPGDEFLSLLQFETDIGEQAIVYSTACHPTVLHADNTLVSADFPGATARILETGPVSMAIFLNGSAGDVSTRFTRKGVGFDEVERLGALLAEQVRGALNVLPSSQAEFAIETSVLDTRLAVRMAESPPEAAQTLDRLKTEYAAAKTRGIDEGELRVLEARCEGALLGLIYSQNQPQVEYLSVGVRFLRVGPLELAFFPFELFSALSNPLRRDMPGVVPVSYANGYYGYLPDAAIEHTDNYEKHTTVFAYGQGEQLMAAVTRHIKENDDG